MKNLRYKFQWLGILFSPFKLPKPSFYFGKIQMGTPYFLPRKWIGTTLEQAIESANEFFEKRPEMRTDKRFQERVAYHFGCQRAIPKYWGVDIVSLGYKSKFDSWRHEWNPLISVVGFNRQFCIWFGLGNSTPNFCYWEAWLTYKHDTDKKLPKLERLKKTMELYGATWGDNKGYTNYWYDIVPTKYHKYINKPRYERNMRIQGA